MEHEKKNSVFIATSLDGYIADKNGGIDWLDTFPEINNIDSGYKKFISQIDALVMGRLTFEKVLSFGIDWPYKKSVYVVSKTLEAIPTGLEGKVDLAKGSLSEILDRIHSEGNKRLYIDGGMLIQSFLMEDLIDEMIITTIPVLLGGGVPLFSTLTDQLIFECVETNLYLDKIVQNRYIRKSDKKS